MREAFEVARRSWPIERLRFLDESGVYRGMARRYGWAEQSARIHEGAPVNYGTSFTMIAAVALNGVSAPWFFEGAMDGAAYLTWLEKLLCPTLEPGDIVITDNLSVHKLQAARDLIHARGARLEFLPPYSPDFNPIENCWSKCKQSMRMQRPDTETDLIEAMRIGLQSITSADLLHSFAHAGYRPL